MNILFVGDVVGKSGRTALYAKLAKLKQDYKIDFTIVNGENIAHGKGITEKLYKELINHGADCVTLGNHAFSKKEAYDFIEEDIPLIRPMNMKPLGIGAHYCDFTVMGIDLRVLSLSGEVFMDNVAYSPFEAMNTMLESDEDILYFVDLHAEASSEKIAFAYEYSNECVAVIGTHTHVQTADEQLINGCAYLTDVGMCGSFKSVIGRDIDEVLMRFRKEGIKQYTVSENPAMICAAVIEVDEVSRRAVSIRRIQIRPELLEREA